ncbi:MAG: calcium/sodium antiporter [Gammaproteobacteria bacterium]|nr:calcium/sodium antiporter [Gammaproteobacteria bacterium]
MLWSLIAVAGGLALLAWSADRFVFGAAAIARNLGVSPLIVGLTIVGFGTSAPELVVSTLAALQGNTNLAIGNALGSNIANIGLVLGLTALLSPFTVRSRIIKREFPVMFAAMGLTLLLIWDGYLGKIDGVILTVSLVLLIAWTVWVGLNEQHPGHREDVTTKPAHDALEIEFQQELTARVSTTKALAWLIVGLLLLLLSARILVWGAINIAVYFGVSDLIIGLTIVAIGTSLPEVAAAVVSAHKGEHDIAIGNIVGSNIFNLLGVIGIPGLLHPAAIEGAVLKRDFPVMLLLSLAMLIVAIRLRGQTRVNRIHGALLLMAYAGYLGLLALTLSA